MANSDHQSLERVRAFYERYASRYDRGARFFERHVWGKRRARLCSLATGDVLEIAAGRGANLAVYPRHVRLTLVELSPSMLKFAAEQAARLGIQVNLRVGDAQALEFADATFDTCVCTLGLCTVPNELQALGEAWRV